jgi:hypothetical protein
VSNLEITGDVKSSLYPNTKIKNSCNLDNPWLEGHFGTFFDDEIFVADPKGGGRRVLLKVMIYPMKR